MAERKNDCENGFPFLNVEHDIIIYSSFLPPPLPYSSGPAAGCNETILFNIESFKYAVKSLNFKIVVKWTTTTISSSIYRIVYYI